MPNVLDVVLLVLVVLFAVSGYRQGFLVGALSFVGFLGGGVLGAKIAKPFTELIGQQGHGALVGLLVVLGLALAGQVAGTAIAVALRDRLTWRPGRAVDAAAGAVLSGVSVLLVAWLLANAVERSPFESLARSVHDSHVLAAVDAGMPDGVRETFADLRQIADDKAFPEVFAGLGGERIIAAGPPDPTTTQAAGVQSAAASIVKIRGVARSCDQRVEGSGFVIAPQRVMTNAHVVAGVRHPTVVLSTGTLPAEVVVFDPDRDVAVLRVPDLQRPPLRMRASPPAAAEEPAVIAGYPQDGPYTTVAARVRNHQRARAANIYEHGTVVRDIYAVRGRVLPGNSGGPLLAPDGTVLGVVFAAAIGDDDTGYVLSAAEVAQPATVGSVAVTPVSTQGCD
ncbi:Trypsin-like peptidase domain/Colicin V production protein [Frankia torreyi]|uniref:Trypsin-like peptidase domain/Colicin V production protein n=2 Tax=Frankia TaxID=1854 RepID=A0A0D8BK32_9ACTN|nr:MULTISPECIES: MarP family serine protease [Frankia]KJE24425.1 Trypsin-like peptidase domain/Colicin V production protein [Frankia torreyi]KQC38387.1 serine protease [Frankia sp. ACN1ag]